MSDMTVSTTSTPLTPGNAAMPPDGSDAEKVDDGKSSTSKVKDKNAAVVREVTTLIQDAITVTTTSRSQLKGTSGAQGTSGAPVLDDPEDLEAIQQDLERLVAFLQMDNDQRQTELAQKRIKGQQDVMDKEHQARLEKIREARNGLGQAGIGDLALFRAFFGIGQTAL